MLAKLGVGGTASTFRECTTMNPTKHLMQFYLNASKWHRFYLILAVIMVAGTLLSLLTRITLMRDDVGKRPRIAVVGPMTGPLAEMGASLKNGAGVYVEALNRQGGMDKRQVELWVVDDGNSAEGAAKAAEQIVADSRVMAVIGHLNPAALKAATPIYRQKKIPLVTPLPAPADLAAGGGVLGMGVDAKEQARFIANYARNVVQQRLMYVIRQEGAEYDDYVTPFAEVYAKFSTPLRQVWTIPGEGASSAAALAAVMEEVKKIDIGAVYIVADPVLAGKIVKGVKDAGNGLEVFGPDALASNAFLHGLGGADYSLITHGVMAATSMLFDTANEDAQRFQTRYQVKHKTSPDWLASVAHDAVRVAMANIGQADKEFPQEVKGIVGAWSFNHGQASMPIQIGVYNGASLISSPVQLQPLARGVMMNYIEALRQGRMLYVNDRFMFRTNVVYVGVRLNEVSDLDLQKEIATLDMSIWFRYRGNFNPQELLIPNALEPVKFETPEESKSSEELQYRRYRIKQKFQLNFTQAKRAYGQHVTGISFRHRQLNRSNLMYVVDVLGMPTGSALVSELQKQKVVKASTGWDIDTAWLSQELVKEQSDGAPQYVGMTGEQPLFSTITLGVLLKPASATARDIIPDEFFIYIAIFGLLGSAMAVFLDRRHLRRYWVVQAWLLRVIFWPLLLLSAGNLVLDYAFTEFTQSTTRTLVNVYESLWWVVGAWLVDMAVRRFLWFGLEDRSGRKIPNVIKFFTTLMLFMLTLAGIVAFVFNQTLTSMLATSGVLAMVIGLAIQANIANVFSGIVLNIERPFKVGDYIKINNVLGQVVDITWRTTRIESNDGQMVMLANSKVSEAEMQNFSMTPHGIAAETVFHVVPEADPDRVMEIINRAVVAAKAIAFKDDPIYAPMVRYKGMVCTNGYWVAEYAAGYRVKILPKKSMAKEELWSFVRKQFQEQGIALTPSPLPRELALSEAPKKAG